MKIRDIVNRDLIDLENCEQEPIHIPGSIQPHGCLLGLRCSNGRIEYASGNTASYFGLDYASMLGRSAGDFFDAAVTAVIRRRMDDSSDEGPVTCVIGGKELILHIHRAGNICVLEAESAMHEERAYPDVYNQTRQFLSYMEESLTLKQLCQRVAERTRQLTGYDRVMIYRFDADYNGEIFAESLREGLEPFLGLHYPHTDIPVQARELYMRNLMRLIVDVNYEPVPVYTIDEGGDRNLDMSLSLLRSASSIHVQYLQNMGVGATLTVSLIHKQRLWGLIACHHYSPKNLTPNLRIAAQLQGHFVASQIDMRLAMEEYDIAGRAAKAVENLRLQTQASGAFENLVHSPELLALCNATGACILFDGKLSLAGLTPDEPDILRLIGELSEGHLHTGYHTAQLSADYPYATAFSAIAAGVIYHPLTIANRDCIIWFRGEEVSEVHWGGDPEKAIIRDENGLHPRKSFEQWRQVVRNKSRSWLRPELEAAASYAYTLQKLAALLVMSANEQRYRSLSERLKAYNEELENINWISTHDLQEPLRKIQLMASRLLYHEDEPLPGRARDLVMRMNRAANRMQTLLSDILNYTRVRNNDEQPDILDLNVIVADVVSDMEEQIRDNGAEIVVDKLPSIRGISFLVSQLFVNLIGNALKFSNPGVQQRIHIGQHGPEERNGIYLNRVFVADRGIGFQQQYADSLFKIFTRLHKSTEFAGSGIGLSLCRKIMEVHGGFISADGKPGQGAVFHLYFPVTGEQP